MRSRPDDVDLIEQIADYCNVADSKYSEALWKLAQRLDPRNARHSYNLAGLYRYSISLEFDVRKNKALAKKAVVEWMKVVTLPDRYNEDSRNYFQSPYYHEKEMLDYSKLAMQFGLFESTISLCKRNLLHQKKMSASRLDSLLKHRSLSIMGRAYLGEGNRSEALKCLQKMQVGQIERVVLFAPDIELANQLLRVGENDAVIKYVDFLQSVMNVSLNLERVESSIVPRDLNNIAIVKDNVHQLSEWMKTQRDQKNRRKQLKPLKLTKGVTWY